MPTASLPSLASSTRSPAMVGDSTSKLEQLQLQHQKLQRQLEQDRAQQSGKDSTPHHVRASHMPFHAQQVQQVQQLPPRGSTFWSTNASSNAELVQNLRKSGIVRSDEVADVMLATDRAKYLPPLETPDGTLVVADAELSYADSPHPIGYNQTISAPHMHAHALELCRDAIQNVAQPRILDIGAGSGYLTACFGRLVRAQQGRVFGIEVIPALAQLARKNIQSADPELADTGAVSVHCANGRDGLPTDAPFHFIHVGAAAIEPPQALLDQLADGGRLVVPLDQERGGQVLVEITRTGNTLSQRALMGVCYVPLVRSRRSSV